MLVLVATFLFFIGSARKVEALSGKGTKASPYVVDTGSDLKTALTKSNGSSWVHIALASGVTVTSPITVDGGKFLVYCKNGNQTLRKSTDVSNSINEGGKKAFTLKNGAYVVFGYAEINSYKLTLDGVKSTIGVDTYANAFIDVDSKSTLTIETAGIMKNVVAKREEWQASPIKCAGLMYFKGEIYGCCGSNGGAIRMSGGTLNVYASSKIHGCTSETEGGAIFCGEKTQFTMHGGNIYSNTSGEEGGGIFAMTGKTEIKGGTISGNEAGASGGGIFSGYQNELIVGVSENSGPTISSNSSVNSGGGIRTNGGTKTNKGGKTIFKGGTMKDNSATKSGGAVACGPPNSSYKSTIEFYSMKFEENYSVNHGGAIFLANGVTSSSNGAVNIKSCRFFGNSCRLNGGAIYAEDNTSMTGNYFEQNRAYDYGGAIFIVADTTVTMSSGEFTSNMADEKGEAIYVKGHLRIKDSIAANQNNKVYLPKDKYIEVMGAINITSGVVAHIESEVKTTGTKLVYINYDEANLDANLYYTGDSNTEAAGVNESKKYKAYGLSSKQLLRTTRNVQGESEDWIIISELYKITYDPNTEADIQNMPDSKNAFWKETTSVSNADLKRKGYKILSDKHWNSKADLSGDRYIPGRPIILQKDVTLYAAWEPREEVKVETCEIRFINEKYLYTLSEHSIWKRKYYDDLQEVVSRDEDACEYYIDLDLEEIKTIKKNVSDNDYKVDNNLNKEMAKMIISA